ncbi:hypothetical protein V8C86DRAFT_2574730 [Haematococcus lacustris]
MPLRANEGGAGQMLWQEGANEGGAGQMLWQEEKACRQRRAGARPVQEMGSGKDGQRTEGLGRFKMPQTVVEEQPRPSQQQRQSNRTLHRKGMKRQGRQLLCISLLLVVMNVNAQEGSGVGGLNVANAPGGIGGAGTAGNGDGDSPPATGPLGFPLPSVSYSVGIDFEVALGLSVSVTLGDQVQLTQSLTLLGDQLGFALAPGILGGPGATGAGAGVGLGGGPGVVVAGRRQTLEQDPDSSRPNATVPSRSSLDKAVAPGGSRPSTGLRNNATSRANNTLGRATSGSPQLIAASDNTGARDAARTQGPLANGSLPEPGGVTPSTTLLVLELAGRERSIQLSVGFASTVSQSASFDLSDTLAALQTQVQDTLTAGRKRRQQRMNAMMQARAGMRNGANGNGMMGMESGLSGAVMG